MPDRRLTIVASGGFLTCVSQYLMESRYAACRMSGTTPTDFDIVLAARSMIRVYGPDAIAEAGRRADADLKKGDVASCATWKRILAAIEWVFADTPEVG